MMPECHNRNALELDLVMLSQKHMELRLRNRASTIDCLCMFQVAFIKRLNSVLLEVPQPCREACIYMHAAQLQID
jgi:hypothetical protein